jgi:GNAT superfamily N-acetyltransferase
MNSRIRTGHATAVTNSDALAVIDRIGTEPADRAAAATLLNTYLGDGLYSPDGLLELADYEQGLGLAARIDGRIVGASVTQILTPDDMDYYDIFGREAHDRLEGHTAASIEAVAVAPEQRGKRIGRELIERNIEWAEDKGCHEFVAISWLGQPANPSWPLFEALRFTVYGESGEIFTRDSIKNGWSCPVDGNPCHCRGRLYVR